MPYSAPGHTVEREGNLVHLAMMELSFLLFAIWSHGMITISLHMFSKTRRKKFYQQISVKKVKKKIKIKIKEGEEKKNPIRKNST